MRKFNVLIADKIDSFNPDILHPLDNIVEMVHCPLNASLSLRKYSNNLPLESVAIIACTILKM
jgi:hypothetical protein